MELIVRDLACARGGARVLEGLCFSVVSGQALVIRGPNGSGKTTLLRTLAGLQPPLSGRIDAPPEAIAYAGHADGIKPTLTVAENLSFWASIYGAGSIAFALAQFELEPLIARAAQNLSAGQKRRLGLARLLVTGRLVWMLDEPTVSLDVDAVAMFVDALRRHLSEGGIALIATHIDLGLPEAVELDLRPFKPETPFDLERPGAFDEAVE